MTSGRRSSPSPPPPASPKRGWTALATRRRSPRSRRSSCKPMWSPTTSRASKRRSEASSSILPTAGPTRLIRSSSLFGTRASARVFGPISSHVLRHTFCSHSAMHGAQPKAIQELAGHSTLQMTMRYAPGSDGARAGHRATQCWATGGQRGGGQTLKYAEPPKNAGGAEGNRTLPGGEDGEDSSRIIEGEGAGTATMLDAKPADAGSGANAERKADLVPDAVEAALAAALDRASMAGEWATVGRLARELESQRVGYQSL